MSFRSRSELIQRKLLLFIAGCQLALTVALPLASSEIWAGTETVTVDFSQPAHLLPGPYPFPWNRGLILVDGLHKLYLNSYNADDCQIENGTLILSSYSFSDQIYRHCWISFEIGAVSVSGVISGSYPWPFINEWPSGSILLNIGTYFSGIQYKTFNDVPPVYSFPFYWAPAEGDFVASISGGLSGHSGAVEGYAGLSSVSWEVVTEPLNLWAVTPMASDPSSVVYSYDRLWQFTPGVPVDVVVMVNGKGIRPTDNRLTTVTLQAGSQPIQSKTVSLQQIKAAWDAGSIVSVPFTVTFGPEDVGIRMLTATINPENALQEEDYEGNVASTLVRVEESSVQYRLFSEIFLPSRGEYVEIQGSTPVKAQYALGSRFNIALERKEGSAGSYGRWKAKWEFVGTPSFENSLDPDSTLFENNVAILFDKEAQDDFKRFQGVHLGTAILRITPEPDQSGKQDPPIHVAMAIKKPISLGSKHNSFDQAVIKFADMRGIPPQIIKGQIEQESGFRKFYRYEPLSVDYLLFRSGNRYGDPRKRVPYKDYILPTNDEAQLAVGSMLDRYRSTVLAPRLEHFAIPVDSGYDIVTAERIYNEFDSFWNWSRIFDPPEKNVFAVYLFNDLNSDPENTSRLGFTAQTAIAASYGYLHILYSTAVDTMKWKGVIDGREDKLNPSYLFDNEENWENGGGSLVVGTKHLSSLFEIHTEIDASEPVVKVPDELNLGFSAALVRYNNPLAEKSEYADECMKFSNEYLPELKASIFGN